MNKWVKTAIPIPVAVAITLGVMFLCWFAAGQVYDLTHGGRDYETERLAEDVVRDLRWLAGHCVYSPLPWAGSKCQESWDGMENTCKGTVAPTLEDFCKDWEVITYIVRREALQAVLMIQLAQDIEQWLGRE